MSTLKERIEQDELFLDSSIVSHGYASYNRDYDIVIEVPASSPIGSGSYWEGRYRYRFTHCPEVRVTTALPIDEDASIWEWDDDFIDYEAWQRVGEPPSAAPWWACHFAYPGLSHVADSALAESWSTRLGREMHEVCVESNVHELRLVCHELEVWRLAVGDPLTGELRPCEEVVIPPAERRDAQWADRAAKRVRAMQQRLLRVRPK
jgi:hypothetical protein